MRDEITSSRFCRGHFAGKMPAKCQQDTSQYIMAREDGRRARIVNPAEKK
jgi:hypothetical protein